jgi:PAS domain-containing protein
MNPVAEKLTGWKEQEAKGRPLNDIFRIVNEKTRQPVESPVSKVLRLGKLLDWQPYLLISKNGIGKPLFPASGPHQT